MSPAGREKHEEGRLGKLAPAAPCTLQRVIVKCGGNKNAFFPRAPQAVLATVRDSWF